MSDPRVDTGGFGAPSTVEAYEEDWYRSLRALAERRKTEVERIEDEPEVEEAGADAVTDAGTGTEAAVESQVEAQEAEVHPIVEPLVAAVTDAVSAAGAEATPTGDLAIRPIESGDELETLLPPESPELMAPATPEALDAQELPPSDEVATEDLGPRIDRPGMPSDLEPLEIDQHPADREATLAPVVDLPPREEPDAAVADSAIVVPGPAAPIDVQPFGATEPDLAFSAEPEVIVAESEPVPAELEHAPMAPAPATTTPEVTEAPTSEPIAPEPEIPEPEIPAGASLRSREPTERREALVELASREPSAAELDAVASLVLDPDAEIRRLAIAALTRAPERLDDGTIRQALQDPADDVRAAAVRAAATRGVQDLPLLAPLVGLRRSPQTQRTVLDLLPGILGAAELNPESLDPLLEAVAEMTPPPDPSEQQALSRIAASIGTAPLTEGLTLPDTRRLGAVRLLASDRSNAVLRALADRAGDPLDEVRQAGAAAAGELARAEADAAIAGPPDIGELAEGLRSTDPLDVERALTTLAAVPRSDVVAWCREHLTHQDPASVAQVASVAAVLDLNEIGVELLTRGAALPPERRRPLVEALADFPDPEQLCSFLAVVPSDHRAQAVHLVWEAAGRRVIADLRALLADPSVEVRVAVIDVISDSADPASLEAVAGLLATDASPDVRAAAVRAVATTDAALAQVSPALQDPDPHVRATALESLPSAPATEVGGYLARALSDLDERVRRAAMTRLAGVSMTEPGLAWSALRQCRADERDELIEAFQRTNPSFLVELALGNLYSPDPEERFLAVEVIGYGNTQACVEAAIRGLGDPVAEVRRAAVAALGRRRDRSAVAALGKALADPDADVRVGAVRALGVIDDEGVLSYLVAALKDPDQRVRETTSHVLTEWSSPAVAKRLAGVLAVPSLRESAADLLQRIGPTSVELLIDVLLQGNTNLRATVGPLLSSIVGLDEFLGRMDSLEPERRLRAAEAIGAIGGPEAVRALVTALSDPDERIRLRATQLLGEIGDIAAADAVRRLVDDPVTEVAAAARLALETHLDSRGPGPSYA